MTLEQMTGGGVVLIPPSCCGAGYFRRVRRHLDGLVECRLLELPGHGRRYRESFLTTPAAAVADLAAQIHGPVRAVYGESLGAYLGLALLARRREKVTLIAGANIAPHLRPPADPWPIESLADARALLAAMGGTITAAPPNAFPLIRADVLLSRALIEVVRTTVIDGDIRVLGGADDPHATDLGAWAAHTTGRCTVGRVAAGHLISGENPAAVAAGILDALRPEPPDRG